MKQVLLYLATVCFLFAVYVDSPWPFWPTEQDKLYGNFACSIGFFCVALALLIW